MSLPILREKPFTASAGEACEAARVSAETGRRAGFRTPMEPGPCRGVILAVPRWQERKRVLPSPAGSFPAYQEIVTAGANRYQLEAEDFVRAVLTGCLTCGGVHDKIPL